MDKVPRLEPDAWYSRRQRSHLLTTQDGSLIRAEIELADLLEWCMTEGIHAATMETESGVILVQWSPHTQE